jgi:hypothetical protein
VQHIFERSSRCHIRACFEFLHLYHGFLSSKRYGLDLVAVKHVALSLHFAIIVPLLAADIVLGIRAQYTFGALYLIIGLCTILLCILLECSTHLPPSIQIYMSVRARANAMLIMIEFRLSVEHLCRLDGSYFTDTTQFSICNKYPLVAISFAS